ncbi:ATP-binding cassette domain-containing protein [Maridesulfovibrio sp.]|uniref:ATP-binding cassette domain-containing protein n=1 Tax=Maridesulfovibrio sp. TaxID=2795000 RepID=UPI002AA6F078|nr:ATP-binding cassette domain-containing protein [Maridesulfovibrio sp.]
MNALLEMRDIVKEFPGVKALDGVSLTVENAEIHAICGENGAGKSTLMRVLSGVYPQGSFSGEILIQGSHADFRNIRDAEGAGIAIIHQELALIPELSITENIFLGNEVAEKGIIDWPAATSKARKLMDRVGLHENPDTPVKNLGVGKQQLVEIAKALSKDARLLILDEPTAALNEDDSEQLLELLRGLCAKGMTCIMISHKLNEVRAVSDAVTIIRDGRTVETLRPGGAEKDWLDEDRIIRGMVGRALTSRFPERTPDIKDVFFEVRDWTVRKPDVPEVYACKNMDFSVRRGEIIGFAGLMGAGRTELARSIFGHSYGIFERGTILKDGREIAPRTVARAIAEGMAYISEDRKSLGLNLLDDIKTSIVSAALQRIVHMGCLDLKQELSVAESYRSSLDIKSAGVDVNVATLSGGNQQKVVLGKWLFTDPDLLILDEPTRGIDVGAKYEIYKLIFQLAEEGRGVIVISSELPELLGLADRIYTIREGEISGVLDKAEADQEKLMRLMTTFTEKEMRSGK